MAATIFLHNVHREASSTCIYSCVTKYGRIIKLANMPPQTLSYLPTIHFPNISCLLTLYLLPGFHLGGVGGGGGHLTPLASILPPWEMWLIYKWCKLCRPPPPPPKSLTFNFCPPRAKFLNEGLPLSGPHHIQQLSTQEGGCNIQMAVVNSQVMPNHSKEHAHMQIKRRSQRMQHYCFVGGHLAYLKQNTEMLRSS